MKLYFDLNQTWLSLHACTAVDKKTDFFWKKFIELICLIKMLKDNNASDSRL